MDDRTRLVQALKNMQQLRTHARMGKVTAIDGKVCRVQLLDSQEVLEGVRLMAVDDEVLDFFVVYPRVGSVVAVSPLGVDGHVYFVSAITEADKLEHMNGGTSVVITADEIELLSGGKATIGNGSVSLKSLLEDILDTIKTLRVATNMGPSERPLPPTLRKCQAIADSITELFNK